MPTNQKPQRGRGASPAELALMERLVDDLTSGGSDLFIAHEREWLGSPLSSFMQGLSYAPPAPTLDPVAIFAKWNSRPALAAPVVAVAMQRPPVISDLDPTAIYAKWNASAGQQRTTGEA